MITIVVLLVLLMHRTSCVGVSVAYQKLQKEHCAACIAGVDPQVPNLNIPILYHAVHNTGPGTLMYNMVHAASYASSRGWIYGGPHNRLGKIATTYASYVFGNDGFVKNNVTQLASKSGNAYLTVDKASNLRSVSGNLGKVSVVFDTDDWIIVEKRCVATEPFPRFRYNESVQVIDCLFNKTFLAALQSGNVAHLNKRILKFVNKTAVAAALMAQQQLAFQVDTKRKSKFLAAKKPQVSIETPWVAMHVRLAPKRKAEAGLPPAKRHYTPDQYYFSIMEIVRAMYPMADIHAFVDKMENFDVKHLDGFVKRNATVHYGASPIAAMSHFIASDIFVMAHCPLSSVSALLNRNCVVYDHYWHGKLNRYLTLNNLNKQIWQCYKPQQH
jgi:hypothetical protein